MMTETAVDLMMNELYNSKLSLRFEYEGCRCTCKEGNLLDWCVIHGLVVYADLVWLEHSDMFLPVKNKAVSRDESYLRAIPEHIDYPKCNCHSHAGRSHWVCQIHGPRAVCNCKDEWYSDHFCPAHGFVPRSDGEEFKFSFQGYEVFAKYCKIKTEEIATEFLAKNAAKAKNRKTSPCDDCQEFPDGCRDNCPMKDKDFSDPDE